MLEGMSQESNMNRGNTFKMTPAVRSIDPRSDGWSDTVPPWPIKAKSSNEQSSMQTSRRKRVQDDIMKAWKEAKFAAVPKPRSTHPRQAAAPRQRERSSSCVDMSSLKPSWGNLRDSLSPSAQSAWTEQLLRRNMSRLAGLPRSVLQNQNVNRAKGSRVIAAKPSLTAADTARMMIEGKCSETHPLCSGRTPGLQHPVVRVSKRFGVTTSDGSSSSRTVCGGEGTAPSFIFDDTVEDTSAADEIRTGSGSTDDYDYGDMGGYGTDQDPLREDNEALVCPTSGGPRDLSPQAAVPRRGFHLVDLHAVVRNSVEWRHCLPKVEPCYRVGSNRDRVLLGLIHALGGRLVCSSVKDLSAANEAALEERTIPSSHPRILDGHVCRSPMLLRAAATAIVRLYEVDCADELRRIREAQQKANTHVMVDPLGDTWNIHPGQKALSSRPKARMRPCEILVKLALPSQPTRKDSLEAVYGAAVKDVVEIAVAADETRHMSGNDKPENASYIVGFSIDVSGACYNDAVLTASLASGGNPCIGSPAIDVTNEAGASGALARYIDLAVAFTVETARRVAETVSIRTDLARACRSKSLNGPASPSPVFSFRRLHVTGLGEAGARGEPLSALKSSLARHLRVAGTGIANGAGASDRPIVVSADATEYLMASGVWSTVAAVIGRKCIAPTDTSNTTRPIQVEKECAAAIGVNGCSTDKRMRAGSAMYYIDDGCYGSLSGALLRGTQMQPSPVLSSCYDRDLLFSLPGSTETSRERAGGLDKVSNRRGPSAQCTVWGPTCDGLDCVSRLTPLPINLRPGKDWLLFQDVGIRGIADATVFNGLKPLDCFYCLRVSEGPVPNTSPVVRFSMRSR